MISDASQEPGDDMALSVGSLFSGIGGIDLGLERAGMVTRWFVEIDPHCRNVLARHWPGLPIYGDITAIDWSGVEPVDVLAGGFPCQPVSHAGLALAQDDPRWLWPEFERAIRGLRPSYVLVENVPGLLQRGLGIVLSDLAALGYDAEWECIPAAAVGAPHIRDRLWLIAYPATDRPGLRVYPPRDSTAADDEREADTPFRLSESSDWWTVEPRVGRVADGLSPGLDRRLAALGNAVVPQVVEWIGHRMTAFNEGLSA